MQRFFILHSSPPLTFITGFAIIHLIPVYSLPLISPKLARFHKPPPSADSRK